MPRLFIHAANNEGLELLDLSWNHIRMKGAVAFCAGLRVCLQTGDVFYRSLDKTASISILGERGLKTSRLIVERFRKWRRSGLRRGPKVQQHIGAPQPEQQPPHQRGRGDALQGSGAQRYAPDPPGGSRRGHPGDVTPFKMILDSCFCSFTPVAGVQLCNSRGSAGSAGCGKESVSNRFGGDQPMRESYVPLLWFYIHEKIHSFFWYTSVPTL